MSRAIARLFSQSERGVMRFGLEMGHKLQRLLGYPDYSYPSIHVAGTNGKGSVATHIAKGLEHAGKKVGLFTSPHLVHYNERFRIDGELASDEQIEKGLAHLFALCDAHQLSPTFFELSTALALHLFAEGLVDYAVIEVGMGGRQDATNVITPALSVITSIGLDHTDRLGGTRQEIAAQKGGIIKRGVPVILGPYAQGIGIEEMAKSLDAPLHLVSGSLVDFRQENRAIAGAALGVLGFSTSAHSEVPGRFQIVSLHGGTLVVDVAHNVPALKRLFQLIEQHYPSLKRRVVAGFTRGHDVEGMVSLCQKEADTLSLITFKSERGVSLPQAPPLDKAWPKVMEAWDQDSELLILCGSCYLVGEFFESIGGLESGDDWQTGGEPRTRPLEGELVPS